MNSLETIHQSQSGDTKKVLRVPGSTYRLQMHSRFGFRDARAVLPYLARLGITDCYTSPILKAAPGSTHGYDITDHNVLNPELGSEADFLQFSQALKEQTMGHLLDFVPNHMGIDPEHNPWWHDVLENGPSSPFARFFDIDWSPVKPELRNKVLLPILSDQYGAVLERGELQLSFDEGAIILRYGTLRLPLNPRQTPEVLKANMDELQKEMNGDPALREYLSIMTALSNLPEIVERDPSRIEERQREKEVARERLATLYKVSDPVRRHLSDCIQVMNGQPGNPQSFDALHHLLEAQAYRLASWKTASHEINYRRFFDINQLAGLRMERQEVFESTHHLLLDLVADKKITGLRLDHPDGLYDPASYFAALQMNAGPIYVVAEKILSPGEYLRKSWAIDGTSGYDFLNLLNHLFIDPRNSQKIKDVYEHFTSRFVDCQEEMYRSKKLIMSTSMASELNVLAHHLNQISETNRRWRDFTLDSLRDALREVVACFPVYRTYISDAATSPSDELIITKAVAYAKDVNPAIDASVFDFIRAMLAPQQTPGLPAEDYRRQLEFAMKFQQYTAPVQAKGVEDTAFYRYNVLLSINEVGGDLGRFGVSVGEFHDANVERQRDWPRALLATATHDTKHGEDARMRLDVLSEVPEEWEKAVVQWAAINRAYKTVLDGRFHPDANDEYLLYQALLSVWTPGTALSDLESLSSRLREYAIKAIREAKRHTSWIRPNDLYEKAVLGFLDKILGDKSPGGFLSAFEPFAEYISNRGITNSLAQLALKLASPGIPDIYQGTELWDWSLVDPDNRRPVDFETRKRLLEEVEHFSSPVSDSELPGRKAALIQLFQRWQDGKIKLLITLMGMRYRGSHADLFLKGSYIPLKTTGELGDHVVAFAREYGEHKLIVVVPHLVAHLKWGPALWASTRVQLPPPWGATSFRNLFTRETACPVPGQEAAEVCLADIFATLPVAWLEAVQNDSQQPLKPEISP